MFLSGQVTASQSASESSSECKDEKTSSPSPSSAINEIDSKIFAHIQNMKFNKTNNNQNHDDDNNDQNYAFSAYGIAEVIKAMTVLFGDKNRRQVLSQILGNSCDGRLKSHHKEVFRQNGLDEKDMKVIKQKGEEQISKKDQLKNKQQQTKPSKQMKEATRIWLDEKADVNSKILHHYKDIIQKIQIAGNVAKACGTINSWVSKNTMGMIKDLLQTDSISDGSKVVVTSTLAFQGKWKEPFQTERTTLVDFKTSGDQEDGNGPTIKVKTMVGTVKANYYRSDEIVMAELPYAGDRYSMVIIVPVVDESVKFKKGKKTRPSTTEILRILQLPGMRKNVKLQVFLPKFKVSGNYRLNEILNAVGLGGLFTSPVEAVRNFHGLRFTEVLHRVSVEVNEEGTKASAGSAGVTSRSFPMQFRVNRAFQFIIRNVKDDVVVFHGHVGKPEW